MTSKLGMDGLGWEFRLQRWGWGLFLVLPGQHSPLPPPSAGFWGPGVDPGRLVAGACAPSPGLGDVRVCVLFRGHHCPARPVPNWHPWRRGLLGHPGEYHPDV